LVRHIGPSPVELEHKAYWAIKEINLDLDAAVVKRRIQIRELEELRLKAYENASIYKERIKRWYNKRLKKKNLKKEIRSSSTIQGLKPPERGNCKANGTDLMLCIRCSPTER
jgi:CDP-glycerol glycerophosphotransferase (TagB/SpsB family)